MDAKNNNFEAGKTFFIKALASIQAQKWEQAEEELRQSLSFVPDRASTLTNLLGVLIAQDKLVEAETVAVQAERLFPDNAEILMNRGLIKEKKAEFLRAVHFYEQAIKHQPDYADAYFNKGRVLKEMNRLEDALNCYETAKILNSDMVDIDWNRAHAFLLNGDFNKGWPLYESRWQRLADTARKRVFNQPSWLGSDDLTEKTILLHGEQGLGDTIQFCRFAHEVKTRGAQVILQVPKGLMSMMQSLAGVDLVTDESADPPAFDYHCPLMSLPLALNTQIDSIPFPEGYLSVREDKLHKWKNILGDRIKPRVGLVWKGSLNYEYHYKKNINLETLLEGCVEGIDYFAIQKDVSENEKILLARYGISEHGAEQNDFSDAAALCSLMDVVISVDTSVAHLSGALGKQTFLLLPFSPNFRWLLNRNDSPWYSSVRLFRQGADRQWERPIREIKNTLLDLK